MDRLWYLIPIALVLVLIIWGPSRLPEIGRGMGRAIREFRSGVTETKESVTVDLRRLADPAPDVPSPSPAVPAATMAAGGPAGAPDARAVATPADGAPRR